LSARPPWQRLMDSPQPPRAFVDFWTSVYQAIDD
jgi:hypothetical protein